MARLNLKSDQLLDTEQAARILNRSPATLATLRTRGGGPPYIRLSPRCIRYHPKDLRDWIADKRVESTSDPGAA